MIEIRNDNTIVISNGDDFDMIFVAPEGIELPSEASKIRIEIKHDIKRDPLFGANCTDIQDDPEEPGSKMLFVTVPEVKKLPPGAYWYDLVAVDDSGKTRTLCWPARLIVAEIAHDI